MGTVECSSRCVTWMGLTLLDARKVKCPIAGLCLRRRQYLCIGGNIATVGPAGRWPVPICALSSVIILSYFFFDSDYMSGDWGRLPGD